MEKRHFWGAFKWRNFRLTLFNIYKYKIHPLFENELCFKTKMFYFSKHKYWDRFQNPKPIYILKDLCFNMWMYKYSLMQKYCIELIPNNLPKFIKVNNHKIHSFFMFLPENRLFSLEMRVQTIMSINEIW